MNKPNLFIIGAPKCGTTSLYEYLKQHPDIFMSEEKEPHYYNKSSFYRFHKDESSYFKLFENSENFKYRGEASVWYFYFKEAIDEILSDAPNSKFIFLVRNPKELIVSLHQELVYIGEESEKNLSKSLDLEQKRKQKENLPLSNSEPKLLHYRDICDIDNHIGYLKKKLDPNQLYVGKLEDLKNSPTEFLSNIWKFLNINPIHLDTKIYNSSNNKSRKSLYLHQLSRVLFKIKRKLNINISFGVLNKIESLNQSNKNIKIESLPIDDPKLCEFTSVMYN